MLAHNLEAVPAPLQHFLVAFLWYIHLNMFRPRRLSAYDRIIHVSFTSAALWWKKFSSSV